MTIVTSHPEEDTVEYEKPEIEKTEEIAGELNCFTSHDGGRHSAHS